MTSYHARHGALPAQIFPHHRRIPPEPRQLRPLHRRLPERRDERVLIERENVRCLRLRVLPGDELPAPRTANPQPASARTPRLMDTRSGRCVGITVSRFLSKPEDGLAGDVAATAAWNSALCKLLALVDVARLGRARKRIRAKQVLWRRIGAGADSGATNRQRCPRGAFSAHGAAAPPTTRSIRFRRRPDGRSARHRSSRGRVGPIDDVDVVLAVSARDA